MKIFMSIEFKLILKFLKINCGLNLLSNKFRVKLKKGNIILIPLKIQKIKYIRQFSLIIFLIQSHSRCLDDNHGDLLISLM
jgi:hypothetical protein